MKVFLRTAFILCALVIASVSVNAQPITPDSVRSPLNISFLGCKCDTAIALNGLRSELSAILPQTSYRKMTPSCKIVFYEPDNTLHPIYAVNPYLMVMPASVEKLFTTSTTLWALGGDYLFRTRLDLLPSARVEAGSVIGSIYLRPSGDPTLRVQDFDELAKRIKAVGINQIEGDIVSDLSSDNILTPDAKKYFAEHSEVPGNPGGNDSLLDLQDTSYVDEGYDSTVADDNGSPDDEESSPGYLSSSPNFFVDRNVITVRVTAGDHKGAGIHISVSPPIANIRVINHGGTSAAAKTSYKRVKVGKGRKAKYRKIRIRSRSTYTLHISASSSPEGDIQYINISGLIPARLCRNFNVPIKNVPLTMAGLLKWRLEQNGIRVTGVAKASTPPKGVTEYKTLAEKQTPLLDLLQVTNKRSDNYLAESMFRKLSSIADVNATNPIERSRKLIRSWLNVINADCKDGYCADGSGLSHQNQTNANNVIDLLAGIRRRSQMYNDFIKTMSIAGLDGTTRGRMIGTAAQYNARSKTGTLNAVTALAGYVSTQDGQLASYFITMQNMHGGVAGYKAIQNQIVQKIAAFKYADYIAKYSPVPTVPPLTPLTAPDSIKIGK